MTCHQTIVWIDNIEACILRMDNGLERENTILARDGSESAANPEGGATDLDMQVDAPGGYFHRVARALDTADEILIVGPSSTKVDFQKYMNRNDHAIDPRILGVETIPHRLDVRLSAFARLYFTEGGPRRGGNGSTPNG